MKRKWVTVAACMAVSLSLTGCGTAAIEKNVTDAANEISDQLSDMTDKQDEHVLFVKNGYPVSYPDISYGNAFDEFFDDPTWKYFKAKTGEDVVEFTGYCVYHDTKVKSRLQFILNMEEETFTQGAMSFNDVPQEDLVTSAMILKAFEEYASKHNVKEKEADDDAFGSGTVTQFHDSGAAATPKATQEPTPEPTPEAADEEEYYYDDSEDEEDDDVWDEGTSDYYILPFSDTEKVTKADLKSLSKAECRIARNEIYARHGRRFSDPELQEYFDKQTWYQGTQDPDSFDESVLSPIEKKNAKFILNYENKLK